MVYGFVKQSGGAVHVSSTPGRGYDRDPAAAGKPGPDSARRTPAAGLAPERRLLALVLLVEDDADVRTVIRRQLTDIGHMVIEAPAGDEALAIIDGVSELSVLVSDIVMPGAMDGRRLAELAKQMAARTAGGARHGVCRGVGRARWPASVVYGAAKTLYQGGARRSH